MNRIIRSMLGGAIALSIGSVGGLAQAAGVTGRPSVSTGGAQGNGPSVFPTISSTGRFVAFVSNATNLVPNDTNGSDDIFLRDRQLNTTQRLSVSSAGGQASGFSERASISDDGRFVVFDSDAANLVSGDTNGEWDVFIRDRQTNTTKRISLSSAGAQGNSFSQGAIISADGRFVAFESKASNLAAGDTNGASDAFVRDLTTGQTTRVSLGNAGQQFAGTSQPVAISANGRYVAFNLIPVAGLIQAFVRDRQTATTTRLSVGLNDQKVNADLFAWDLSADGRLVTIDTAANNLIAGDTNGVADTFVRDLKTGATTRVSVGPGGAQGNGASGLASLSANGRYVIFDSWASNLVANDTNNIQDVFLHDRTTRKTSRVSISRSGTQGNSNSENAVISADGKFGAFDAFASTLIAGDTNGTFDVFIAPLQ